MTRRITLLGWIAIAAGFAAIGGGWVGVQSTPVVAVQLSYLVSGALVGVALVVVGTGLLRQDDLRAIREMVEELRDRFDDIENELASGTRRVPEEPVRRSRAVKVPQDV